MSRLVPLLLLLLATPSRADGLEVFDACWRLVRKHFYDEDLHGIDWEAVRRKYRPEAARALGMRPILERMLAELDVSHAAILEGAIHRELMAELRNERVWTFGLWMEEIRPGRLFVRALFEGGPAAQAGLRTGDRIVRVDGVDARHSSAIVDAGYDPNFRGPRRLTLLARPGQTVRLEAERRRGVLLQVDLVARSMNGVDATRNSVRVLKLAGCVIGTMHIWYCSAGVEAVLGDALENALRDCEALVVDLRGRGGYSHVGKRILDRLRRDGRPAAFLIDRRTRSAKEVLAYRIRKHEVGPLVGARTEGAVLGAGFFPLPDGSVLELPIMEVKVDGLRLEGVGVAPDHRVETSLPFSAGRDAILATGCAVAVRERNRRLGWTLVRAENADKKNMIERRGNREEPREEGMPRRLEIDLIRFQATRLPSGLYRHQPVKWIFEISRHQRLAAARKG